MLHYLSLFWRAHGPARGDPVFQDWLATRQLLQRQFAALVVKILEPVEAVPAVFRNPYHDETKCVRHGKANCRQHGGRLFLHMLVNPSADNG
jgi:hypothetical protein